MTEKYIIRKTSYEMSTTKMNKQITIKNDTNYLLQFKE